MGLGWMSVAIIKNIKQIPLKPVTYPFTLITGSGWTNQTIVDYKHKLLDSVTVSTYGSASKGNAGFQAQGPSDQETSCGGTITIKLKPTAIGKVAKLNARFYATGRSGSVVFNINNGDTRIWRSTPEPGDSPAPTYNSSFVVTDDTITISASYSGYSSAWTPSARAYVYNLTIDEE